MSALDDYTVKRAETRRAEIVTLTAAALSALATPDEMFEIGTGAEDDRAIIAIATRAVILAIEAQGQIDNKEGDSY